MLQNSQSSCGRFLMLKHSGRPSCCCVFRRFYGRFRLLKHSRRPLCCSILRSHGQSQILKHSRRPSCCSVFKRCGRSLLLKSSRLPSYCSILKGLVADLCCCIHGEHHAAVFPNVLWPIWDAKTFRANIMLQYFQMICGRSLSLKHHGDYGAAAISKVCGLSLSHTATIFMQYYQTIFGRSLLLKHSRRPSCCSIFKLFMADL